MGAARQRLESLAEVGLKKRNPQTPKKKEIQTTATVDLKNFSFVKNIDGVFTRTALEKKKKLSASCHSC